MRLIFSSTNHMNTDVSDERGYIYYTISTPAAFNKVTTITKYQWTDMSGQPETAGVIEWHRWKPTVFRFDGREIPESQMLYKRPFEGYVSLQPCTVVLKFDVLLNSQRSVFCRSRSEDIQVEARTALLGALHLRRYPLVINKC